MKRLIGFTESASKQALMAEYGEPTDSEKIENLTEVFNALSTQVLELKQKVSKLEQDSRDGE